jgi:hypothetical protein
MGTLHREEVFYVMSQPMKYNIVPHDDRPQLQSYCSFKFFNASYCSDNLALIYKYCIGYSYRMFNVNPIIN